MPEADALRDRTQACRRWVHQIHNELLRRTSARKVGGVRLSVTDVEGLLREAETLQLEAIETTQAYEKLVDARKWSEEAIALLLPLVPVTPLVLLQLEELGARAEELNLALAEQEVLDARLGWVKDWLQRSKVAMESHAPWQTLTALVKEAKAKKV